MDGDKGIEVVPVARKGPYGRHSWEWEARCLGCGKVQTVTLAVHLSDNGITATIVVADYRSGEDSTLPTRDAFSRGKGGAAAVQRPLDGADAASVIGRAIAILMQKSHWWNDAYLCDVIEQLNRMCSDLLHGIPPDRKTLDDPPG